MTNPPHATPDLSTLYVVGAGGHGREIAWLARRLWGEDLKIIHLVDRMEFLDCTGAIVDPVQLLGDVSPDPSARVVVAIGDIATRKRLAAACDAMGFRATNIVHPQSETSPCLGLAQGVVVAAGCVLTTNVTLGQHVHINIGCTVSHDVRIGEYSTLSPGVHVSGHVHIGNDVFIGTGAVIINGTAAEPLIVGEGATIAAGACVTTHVEAGALVAGVPATRKRSAT